MSTPVVLYVEDEEDDQLLMKFAFDRAGLSHALQRVGDGRDAIKYLSGENSYADRERHPMPSVVLLDLNLPVVSGFQVMEWLREHPALRKMPVVVFSSSTLPEDRRKAGELGAKEFIEKPTSSTGFGQVVERLRQYWRGPETA